MHNIYLLLGSNLGRRETYLEKSRRIIEKEIGKIEAASSLYQTASWGKTNQPDFINQVLKVTSGLSAETLLKEVLSIEEELGRTRREKWGARTIDIDILFYDDAVINLPDLVIPHPFLHLRRFTLEPLMELAPELKHPVLGSTIKELTAKLEDNLLVKRINA